MSVTPDEVKARIEAGIPGAVASVTGDGHHFNAVVSAPASLSPGSSTTCSARSWATASMPCQSRRELRKRRKAHERRSQQPDARSDPERDLRKPGDPVHEGNPGGAGVRLLGPHRRDPAVPWPAV